MKKIVQAYLDHRSMGTSLVYNGVLLLISAVVGWLVSMLLVLIVTVVLRPSSSQVDADFLAMRQRAQKTLTALGFNTMQVHPAEIVSDHQIEAWETDRQAVAVNSFFLCISKEGSEFQLIGITSIPRHIMMHASESCKNKDDQGIVPMQHYPIADETSLLGLTFLPEYKISVFPQNHTDLIVSRLGKDIAIGGRGIESDRARVAAVALKDQLFSFRGISDEENSILTLSSTTSWFHRIILIAFIFSLSGSLLIYWTVITDSDTKGKFSFDEVKVRLKFYHEVLHALPTLSLIGTMTGLTITLSEFLGRTSPDPTEAVKANSAALGGIILAFTTTIMAALLLLIGWNLIVVNADARLEAEFEKDGD